MKRKIRVLVAIFSGLTLGVVSLSSMAGTCGANQAGVVLLPTPTLVSFFSSIHMQSNVHIEHDINAWGANPPSSSNRFTCVSATAAGTPFVITGSGQWNSKPASFAIPLTVKPGKYYFAVVGTSQSDLDMAGTYSGLCHQVSSGNNYAAYKNCSPAF